MTEVPVKSIAGYKDPDEYHTPFSVIMVVNLVLLVALAELFFPGVVARFYAAVPFSAAELLQFLSANQSQVAGFVLFNVALIIVHELIHVAAHKWNGSSLAYGVRWVWLWKLPNPVPYVVVLDDLLTRSENIWGLLAPLVVLTAVGLIGLLPLFPPIVTYYAKVLLVINTAGSSADIYNSMKVFRYPQGTLFRNIMAEDEIRTFTYEPE